LGLPALSADIQFGFNILADVIGRKMSLDNSLLLIFSGSFLGAGFWFLVSCHWVRVKTLKISRALVTQ